MDFGRDTRALRTEGNHNSSRDSDDLNMTQGEGGYIAPLRKKNSNMLSTGG